MKNKRAQKSRSFSDKSMMERMPEKKEERRCPAEGSETSHGSERKHGEKKKHSRNSGKEDGHHSFVNQSQRGQKKKKRRKSGMGRTYGRNFQSGSELSKTIAENVPLQKRENTERVVTVKDVNIGEGIPKICVPIVGRSVDEILNQANQILYSPADIVEWRVDYFRRSDDIKAVLSALRKLTERLEGRPLLFTFRTAEEGGEKDISRRSYLALYEAVMASGYVDLADIEYNLGEEVTGPLTSLARSSGTAVVFSYHDFRKTPSEGEIIRRLNTMKELGADIAKIAVMPRSARDVLTLLSATEKMKHQENPIPIITVSMSAEGLISRISGEIFGSAVTFASAGRSSAPGQISADQADRLLLTIHRGSDESRIKGRPCEGKKNVILIGFMGTGKSTVARKISKKTGMKVKEMDDMIVKQEKMSVKDIFERYGEAYFRDAETRQTKIISESSGVIVSCGGGTVMRQKNVDYLKKKRNDHPSSGVA